MQTTMEPAGKHTVKLTVEVPPEEFAKDLDRTYREIANSVKVPGFPRIRWMKRTNASVFRCHQLSSR